MNREARKGLIRASLCASIVLTESATGSSATATGPQGVAPRISYSTFLGTGSYPGGVAVDKAGHAFVAVGGGNTARVLKLDSAGRALLYDRPITASRPLYVTDLAADAQGRVYVAGFTAATDLPVANATQAANAGGDDAFVFMLGPGGEGPLFLTYLGGSAEDQAYAIAVDPDGGVYVTGRTRSSDFPTSSPYQSSLKGSANAFLTKLAWDGSQLRVAYSTYFGGSVNEAGHGVTVSPAGEAALVGVSDSPDLPRVGVPPSTKPGNADAFLAKFAASGDALVFSRLFGGSGNDAAFSVEQDASGRTHVAGFTDSTNLPVTGGQTTPGGSGDVFYARFSPDGVTQELGTYLGGGATEGTFGRTIGLDPDGGVFVTGYTQSSDFPTRDAVQPGFGGVPYDGFVARISALGEISWATYLGGAAEDHGRALAVDGNGSVYVAGFSKSQDFVTTEGAYRTEPSGALDATVTKIGGLDASRASRFHPMTPCRVVDTRNEPSGPLSGPALAPTSVREFTVLRAPCSIPITARALAVNLTVVDPSVEGQLTLFADGPVPQTSSISFRAERTRANNGIVSLSGASTGAVSVWNGSTGAVHFVLDVSGYFE